MFLCNLANIIQRQIHFFLKIFNINIFLFFIFKINIIFFFFFIDIIIIFLFFFIININIILLLFLILNINMIIIIFLKWFKCINNHLICCLLTSFFFVCF